MSAQTSTDIALRVDNLDLGIGSISVCNGLNLEIREGQCWGLLGANGIGKTTLLHTLAGLKTAQAGALNLYGTPLHALSRRQIARQLGLLAQHSEDAFPGTVFETALAARYPQLAWYQIESADDRQRVTEALGQVELADYARRSVTTLSGGERQRLALACLLVQSPSLALLDEPANHLDLRHQYGLLAYIRQHFTRPGRAALMVLHDPNLCARYCDHVLMLFGNGEWLAGDAASCLQADHLSRLYQHPVKSIGDAERRCFVAGGAR